MLAAAVFAWNRNFVLAMMALGAARLIGGRRRAVAALLLIDYALASMGTIVLLLATGSSRSKLELVVFLMAGLVGFLAWFLLSRRSIPDGWPLRGQYGRLALTLLAVTWAAAPLAWVVPMSVGVVRMSQYVPPATWLSLVVAAGFAIELGFIGRLFYRGWPARPEPCPQPDRV